MKDAPKNLIPAKTILAKISCTFMFSSKYESLRTGNALPHNIEAKTDKKITFNLLVNIFL